MKKKLDILKWLLPIVALLATACGHDDLVLPDVYEVEEPAPYVEIRIAVPLANPYTTRANPMGGEEGNGRERGLENEDKIHDINVFFFENVKGLNGDENSRIVKHLYYNFGATNDDNSPEIESVSDDNNDIYPYFGIKYIKLKVKYWEDDIESCTKLKFYVIANIGRIYTPATLGELRGLRLDNDMNSWMMPNDVFSRDASKYSHFLMSTAYDAEYKYGSQSTGTNSLTDDNQGGYSGIATVQRLYARLDIWYNKSQIKTITDGGKAFMELDYQIKDKDKDETPLPHHVYITNVLPVNVMQKPSYVFKMVTNGVNSFSKNDLSDVLTASKYLWGGKESPNEYPTATSPNDRPKNYVIERHTLEKMTVTDINNMTKEESSYYNTSILTDWYGNTAVSQVKVDIANKEEGKLSAYFDCDPNSSSDSNSINNSYGCDHVSIISYANENTHPTDCYHSNYLTGMALRAVYVPDKIYTNFTSSTTTTEDEDGNETTVTTETLDELNQSATSITGGKIYRYSPTSEYNSEIQKENPKLQLEKNSIYFSDRVEAEKYAKANPEEMGIITEYIAIKHGDKWGFICYYNFWLRHYNNESAEYQENFPMEYATVRNNIYRAALEFSGPGDPEPTMREPDTMKARIFVRKWNYRKEDEIIF